jgi:hypothetical protein
MHMPLRCTSSGFCLIFGAGISKRTKVRLFLAFLTEVMGRYMSREPEDRYGTDFHLALQLKYY